MKSSRNKSIINFMIVALLTLPAMALASPQDDFVKGAAAYEAKDYPEALRWYRKAAEQGHAKAQYHLGRMYLVGFGVARDTAEAVRWYRKAAEQGLVKAQSFLGGMYESGFGVARNDREAVRWSRKAAEQGDARAQSNFGVMYYEGRGGVAQNYREALRWFRKAAEQGDARAHSNLGNMYSNGHGVKQDYVQAHKWSNIAVALGYGLITKTLRQEVEKKMSAQQIDQAQTEATKWLEAHKKRRP